MKKILFVVDTPGKAFDIVYDELHHYLPFDCHKTYLNNLDKELPSGFDYIHFMNWLDGKEYGERVSGGLCSHNFEIKHLTEAKKRLPKMKAIAAISPRLLKAGLKLNTNSFYCPNGVCPLKFRPMEPNKGDFTIGWVGQKTTGGFGEKKNREGFKIWDIKGYEILLKPLMEKFKGKVKFDILGVDHGVNHNLMPSYYKSIDILLCTSLYEGCPLPVLEAASVGRPILSTDVGIVDQVAYPVNIINPPYSHGDVNRCLGEFQTRIEQLINLRGHYESILLHQWRNIEKFHWENVAPRWYINGPFDQ